MVRSSRLETKMTKKYSSYYPKVTASKLESLN
jgi:hypothetical protein